MNLAYKKEKRDKTICADKNEDPCVYFEVNKNLSKPRINSFRAIEREIEFGYHDLQNLPSKVRKIVRNSKETDFAIQEKGVKRINYGRKGKMFDNLCSMDVDHLLWEELQIQFASEYKKTSTQPRERDWEPRLEDYQKQECKGWKTSSLFPPSIEMKRESISPILNNDFTLKENDIFFAQTANLMN